jgi:hypothetical protein
MASPVPIKTEDALEELVNQFADPMSFLRELVQNALDAGSSEVEISVSWQGGDVGVGVAITLVEDWGVGMTKEVIETRLTRLFSSDKDGDKTKIGKFGIGFVSVFAIDPDAVCVDTSRDGQSWRVLFDAQRRFSLLRLDEPIDGTKVRILKSMDRSGYDAFVRRAREVVEYWCRHTAGEIRFDGDLINRPLDLEAPCRVVHDDGFSRIVVGHPCDGRTFFGFYNTGLTLLEGHDRYLEGLAFKASSPHLEHTLTRDSIIEDAGFDRVMRSLNRAVDEALEQRVFAQLEQTLELGPSERLPYLYRAALWHARRPGKLSKVAERVAFRTPSGTLVRLRQVRGRRREQQILISNTRSPMTDALELAGFIVIDDAAGQSVASLLAEQTSAAVQRVEQRYAMPLVADDEDERDRWAPLSVAVAGLLEDWGAKLSSVELAHFDYPGSSIAGVLAITQRTLGELTSSDELGELGTGMFSRRRVLVVNVDHPLVSPAVVLAAHEPELAAYMLVKAFFVGVRLDPEVDGRLLGLASERRWRAKSTG